MQLNNYTHYPIGKKAAHSGIHIIKHIESLLLWLLATTGVIGTVFLISQHLNNPLNNNKGPEMAAISTLLGQSDNSEQSTSDFDQYIQMPSKANAGEVIEIKFLQDETASRYVMEMGNGERLIVTQKDLIYTYDQPGKYVIELKEIRRGILRLIGTKKIKVK
ncbi:MAG: hypothetical protein IPM26_15675 [Saprospiraceae bacterium]|nr:hypothetical protein [Saprospiraceae bacterium]